MFLANIPTVSKNELDFLVFLQALGPQNFQVGWRNFSLENGQPFGIFLNSRDLVLHHSCFILLLAPDILCREDVNFFFFQAKLWWKALVLVLTALLTYIYFLRNYFRQLYCKLAVDISLCFFFFKKLSRGLHVTWTYSVYFQDVGRRLCDTHL